MSLPPVDFVEPIAPPTHADSFDLTLIPDDFRVLFEEVWPDNERLRRELLLRETILRRLVAENRQLREIIAHISLVGETLANENPENVATGPLPAPHSPDPGSGAPQEPEFS